MSNFFFIVLYFAFIGTTINVGASFEYSPLPVLISYLFLTKYIKTLLKTRILFSLMIIVHFFCLLFSTTTGSIEPLKEAAFFAILSCGYIYCYRCDYSKTISHLLIISIIFLVVAVFEYLSPDFSAAKSIFLTRSVAHSEEFNARGVSSLSTEPSFFSLTIFSLWLIVYSLLNFNKLPFNYSLIWIVCLVLSKSTMIILIIPLILLTTDFSFLKNNIPLQLSAFFVLIIVIYNTIDNFDSNTFRAIQILISLFENLNFEFINDDSAKARLFYINKDLYLSGELFLFPSFPGSYELIQSMLDAPNQLSSPEEYSITMSGSLLGRFLVEFGFLIFFFIFYLFYKLLYKFSIFKLLLVLLIFICIYLQMISLLFSPISFSLGFAMYKIFNLKFVEKFK